MKDGRSRLWPAVLIALALVQGACDRRRPESVLVIAVDSLPFNLSLCTRDAVAETSGFRRLCDESIRFTHALTPSVLAVPALASLITGMNPVDHGVRHNGGPELKAGFTTFAEIALRHGRRTAFFSGGAPVWRRSGLQQGFETFDDGVGFQSGRLFRPAAENSALFRQWLAEIGGDSFAAVIYVPDLNFTDTVTETPSGEMRPLSDESQLEELDETLGELFEHLRLGDRWNDTMIVVAGLNGREISPRPGEIEPLMLNSENTQVSLFIKPTAKPRDEAITWKIDRNVSLTDVGRTILDVLGGPPPKIRSGFDAVSLKATLTSAQPDWLEDRPLPVESGWAVWQGWGPVRMGAMVDRDLVIDDEKPVVFNTLVDRLETSPVRLTEQARKVLDQLQDAGSVPWPGIAASRLALFRLPRLDWLIPARGAALHRGLQALASARKPDPRVLRWAAQLALEQRDWARLAELGRKAEVPLWTAVAERNLGKKSKILDPCLKLLEARPGDPKTCSDETVLALYGAVRAEAGNRDNARRRLARAWETHQFDLRILKANAGMGLLWLPASSEEGLPSLGSLAMALPEMKKFAP